MNDGNKVRHTLAVVYANNKLHMMCRCFLDFFLHGHLLHLLSA